MSIRLAAANPSANFAPGQALTKKMLAQVQGIVANDNGADRQAADKVLRAALHHFAQHGLGAAKVARAQAEKAFFDGDRETYDWWLGITRTLDRRLAESVSGPAPGKVNRTIKGAPRLMK